MDYKFSDIDHKKFLTAFLNWSRFKYSIKESIVKKSAVLELTVVSEVTNNDLFKMEVVSREGSLKNAYMMMDGYIVGSLLKDLDMVKFGPNGIVKDK